MQSRMGSALAKLLQATRNFLPKSYAVQLVRKDQLLDLALVQERLATLAVAGANILTGAPQRGLTGAEK